MNTFPYSNTNKHYHTLDYFYKQKFKTKVCKISLNAGFTCPNIDGNKGYNGCIYCSKSGSGEFGGNPKEDLIKQFNTVKKIMDNKWPNSKYIGYFQARTNTYAPLNILKEKYETILNLPNVVGLSIATRPDAITDECIEYLKELNKKTFITVELGLQTIHEKTSKLINRCHNLKCFEDTLKKLKDANIFTVVHIINGLPYETKEMMIETVKYLNDQNIDGIKIHMLLVLKDTPLEKYYKNNKFHILTKDEYVDIVTEQLKYLNPKIVIQRLTADPPKDDLIEPKWTIKKIDVLNSIDKKMKRDNIYQGEKIKV
ncbi:MAG: TIGR01212 family radical SAM protein [Bacilli bacterium]|nr:TIGR01212 family radical SAM protein [Bacilli bacterium]